MHLSNGLCVSLPHCHLLSLWYDKNAQQWRGSVALRIPKAFAMQVNLDENSIVEVMLLDGMLAIAPAPRRLYMLDHLFVAMKDENIRSEVDTSERMGQENK